MGLHPVNCPVCGGGYMALSAVPEPCSSVCRGRQYRENTARGAGSQVPDPHEAPAPGRHRSGKTVPQRSGVSQGKGKGKVSSSSSGQGGGWCSFALLGIVTVAVSATWAAGAVVASWV